MVSKAESKANVRKTVVVVVVVVVVFVHKVLITIEHTECLFKTKCE